MTARFWLAKVAAILLAGFAYGESLADMDGESLKDAFNGGGPPGFMERLERELSGYQAGYLIEKCKSDPGLRNFLVAFPQYMPKGRDRDDLILYVLREQDVWFVDRNEDERVSAERARMQIHVFVTPCLGSEFALAPDDDGIFLLNKAIVGRASRLEVAKVFEEVMKLPSERRHQGDPQMAASVRALRKVLAASHNAKAGTKNSTGLKGAGDGVDRDSGRRPAKSAVEKPLLGASESKNRWTQVGLWGLLIAGGAAFAVFTARRRVM